MQISYQNIDESLNSLDKIYAISGDEPLFIQETKEKIRKKCINAGYTDRESIVVTKDYNWSYLLKSSENIDMFDDQKILELKMAGNGPGINGSKVLKAYLQQPTESQILIISLEGLDKKTLSGTWVKDLQKHSTFITVQSLRTSEITPWIIKRAKQYNLEFTPDATSLLLEMTEGNLFTTLREIQKLSLLHPNEKIDYEKMANAITNSSIYGVFDLTNAFIAGNKKKTIKIFEYFKLEGVAELQILGLLSKELSNLYSVKTTGSTKNIFGPQFYKDRLLQASKNLSLSDIKKGLVKVADIDAASKGQGTQSSWQGLRQLTQLFF